ARWEITEGFGALNGGEITTSQRKVADYIIVPGSGGRGLTTLPQSSNAPTIIQRSHNHPTLPHQNLHLQENIEGKKRGTVVNCYR
ncbi:hypothetical protein BgiBS90_026618, partial [Biomphalaria glabrata]